MKKTKIIVPALGMLLLSTAASVTGTVAWFAVNTSVTVTGLEVKAKAEGGIVIAPYTIVGAGVSAETGPNTKTPFSATAPAETAFKNEADCELPIASLYPTSTANATAWYHATSNDVNNYQQASGYQDISASLTTDGKTYGGDGSADTPWVISGQYFLYSKYKVKSTSSESSFGLYIREIEVTASGANTEDFDQSLRVAIKAGTGAVKFFAPLYESSDATTLKWVSAGASANATVTKGDTYTSGNLLTANNTEVVKAGIDLEIWVYYEGEDVNCTTYNIDKVTVDELSIDFTFATTAAAA